MNKILLDNNELFDKLQTHKQGLRHFAFSLFLFNEKNELLLQKRSINKYHSGGLWSNTCCSHFKNIEEKNNITNAIQNRVFEELGIKYTEPMTNISIYEYNENVGNGLIENEIDYIFLGRIKNNFEFNLNKDEAEEIKFIDFQFLLKNINKDIYTVWLYNILHDANIVNKINNYLK